MRAHRQVRSHKNDLKHTLVAGTLLNALAFFAALPYLPLYLRGHWNLDSVMIGLTVGIIPMVAALGGGLSGLLADRHSPFRMLTFGIFVTAVAYVLLATIPTLPVTVVLIFMLGIGRMFMEPAGKKLLSVADEETGTAFRWRHAAVSLGAIVGPLVGGITFQWSHHAYFLVPAFFYVLYLTAVLRVGGRDGASDYSRDREQDVDIEQRPHRRQLGYVLAFGVLVFVVFSQLDSIFPLLIDDHLGDVGIAHYTSLLIVNAGLNVLWQVVYARMEASRWLRASLVVGLAAFAMSLVVFWVGLTAVPLLYASIVIWSIGQAALLPGQEIMLHRISAHSAKGLYFGLGELRYLGFFFGSWVGGALIAHSLALYFGFLLTTCLLTLPLIVAATKEKQVPRSKSRSA